MPYNVLQNAFPQPMVHIKPEFFIPFRSEFQKTCQTIPDPNQTEVNHPAKADLVSDSVCFVLNVKTLEVLFFVKVI